LIDIDVIDTPSLGDRSYLATDGEVAIVIDPQRDIDRVLGLAEGRGVAITHVFETHIHNDYVTGGLALAMAAGAEYHVCAADHVRFDRVPVADGQEIVAGKLLVRVIATPGHTFNHLSYAVGESGQVAAVFTGGSLLNGSTGRTDLLGPQHSVALARAQHSSVRRLAGLLPRDAKVCPTHGFGSFCSASPASGRSTTIGAELIANPALIMDEDEYVASTLAGLDAYPAYYAHMAPANSAGPLAPDLAPPRLANSSELRRRIDAGEWVVDMRSRIAFAAGHVRGTLQFELSELLATYLGWLIPWGMPLTLLGQTAADVAAAQRELARIGIERFESAATGSPQVWSGGEPLDSYPVIDFAGLARERKRRRDGEFTLVDVRLRSEWDTSRIAGAINIPLHELPGRIGDLGGGTIWVHCQSGYRAGVAASLLEAAGREVVHVNGDFSQAQEIGLADDGVTPVC
jgi:hydroxyacylglutathione hydrolase